MNWLPSNGRPSATFAYRNFAASYLIAALPLVLALWVRRDGSADLILSTIAAAGMLVFLTYTRTRGAWAGLLGAALATGILALYARYRWGVRFDPGLRKPRLGRQIAVVVPIAVGTVALVALPPRIVATQSRLIDEKKVDLVDALSSVSAPGADRGRRAMWRHTWEMIQDHGALGVGPGNWRYIYPAYDGGDMLKPGSAPERPHNDFLWVASESGLLGLLAFVWLIVVAGLVTVRAVRHSTDGDRALLALAFGASVLALLGHSLFSFPKERIETSFHFWLGLGVLVLLDRGSRSHGAAVARSTLQLWGAYLVPALLLLATAVTYRHIQFDRHYHLARRYFLGNDYRSMHAASRAALSYGVFEPQALLLNGKGNQAAGLVGQALHDNLRGLRYHPNSVEILGDLGICYAMLDSLDRAEACFQRALELSPDHFRMHNNLGGVYHKKGDYDLAIESYRRSLAHDATYVDAHSNLGLVYTSAGRFNDAVSAFSAGLALEPDDPALLHNLADAYYAKAQTDESCFPAALDAYERFLSRWRGPAAQTRAARQRIDEIRRRLRRGDGK
jgi:O-antigen ligase/Flp pilus assembly protein TadD